MELQFLTKKGNAGFVENTCYDIKKSAFGELLLVWKEDALLGLYLTSVPPIPCSKGVLTRGIIQRMIVIGSTFQIKVWKALLEIPFGERVSYKWVGERIGCRGFQAVGHAIGSNPISLLIPCHRVIASDGSLHGYRFGLDVKQKILKFESENASKKISDIISDLI